MNIFKNEWLKFRQRQKPYEYHRENYAGTFIAESDRRTDIELKPFEKVIYTFWTGNNQMSPNRNAAFQQLVQKAGVPVKLITPENLPAYILEQHPLHPAFNNLSLVHKADYLRCYFMHFHGGGYSDIKGTKQSWEPVFELLQDSEKWIAGYPEKKYKSVARPGGILNKELEKNFLTLIGNCAYISRPQTPFTAEWYAELQRRMDNYAPALAQYPGNTMGDNENYPIPWTNILGNIFHPLCLKYHDQLLRTTILFPMVGRHR